MSRDRKFCCHASSPHWRVFHDIMWSFFYQVKKSCWARFKGSKSNVNVIIFLLLLVLCRSFAKKEIIAVYIMNISFQQVIFIFIFKCTYMSNTTFLLAKGGKVDDTQEKEHRRDSSSVSPSATPYMTQGKQTDGLRLKQNTHTRAQTPCHICCHGMQHNLLSNTETYADQHKLTRYL